MHNFVYLAQRRSQEFSCEPNFGGGACPAPPPGCATATTVFRLPYSCCYLARLCCGDHYLVAVCLLIFELRDRISYFDFLVDLVASQLTCLLARNFLSPEFGTKVRRNYSCF